MAKITQHRSYQSLVFSQNVFGNRAFFKSLDFSIGEKMQPFDLHHDAGTSGFDITSLGEGDVNVGSDHLYGLYRFNPNLTDSTIGNKQLRLADLIGPTEGGPGNDTLIGGDGTDLFHGGAGADLFDGRAGDDIVSYDDAPEGLILNLGNTSASTGIALNDSYISIEIFEGSRYGDTILGTATHDAIYANYGDDVVRTFGGDDFLDGQGGNDQLDGGTGDDYLVGGEGNDTLWGGDDRDMLLGGAGADVLDGGANQDVASYDDATEGLIINIGNSAASTDIAKNDIYISIEAFLGSRYDDQIEATAANDLIYANYGDDVVRGFDGNDFLDGQGGDDQLDGGAGNDELVGGDGNDELVGGDGNDKMWGGAGADKFDGGADVDTVSYDDAASGLTLNLGSTSASTGIAKGDSYVSVEVFEGSRYADKILGTASGDVIYANYGNDNLQGNKGNDHLYGQAGNDSLYGGTDNDDLYGGDGNDLLVGGSGSDTLDGNLGQDVFMFDYLSTIDAGVDTIKGFSVADDSIQIDSDFYTSLKMGGETPSNPLAINPAFFKIGSQATDANDFLVYDDLTGVLYYDADGSGIGAARALAIFDTRPNLSAANFFVI